jgi:1,4-alpha-glucan branching enzyme
VNWGGDGAGFDAQWYSEYHHKLIGVLNDAASGRQPSMKGFVDMLAQPRGLDGWGKAMTIFTNHDEAGWRIAAATAGGTDRPIGQWAQNAARLAAGVALLSPGRPIFLSGEESLAQRGFAWGNPASWDLEWGWKSIGSGWNWDELTFSEAQRGKYERLAQLSSTERARDAEYLALNATDRSVCDTLAGLPDDRRTALSQDIQRRQTFNFYKDVLGERARGPASRADAEVRPVYAHDENRVMAFSRRLDGEEIVVVSNLAQFGYPGYGMELPPGQWQIAFNSDEKKYGGEGTFTQDVGTRVGGGFSRVSLPPGGVVVLKRVG